MKNNIEFSASDNNVISGWAGVIQNTPSYINVRVGNKDELEDPKIGDLIIDPVTKEQHLYVGDKFEKISDDITVSDHFNDIDTIVYGYAPRTKMKRTKKIIPHPLKCELCAALLDGYVCKHCGAEYPEFEYIMEEEITE